jgi:hypothetical protein
MSGTGLESEPTPVDEGPRDDLVAAGLGLLALAIACVPLALLVLAPGDAGANIQALPDARQWPGLRWFGLASALGAGPTFVLARLALDRARRWPAKVPAALAIVAGLPMIPGAVIQIAWWTSG